jgi:hypothetical protein
VTSWSDYGEYFEWADGNINKEDRRGYFVTFDVTKTDKIKIATSNSYIIGSVTQKSGVIGNGAELAWAGAIKRDKFNQPVKEYNYSHDLRMFSRQVGLDIKDKKDAEIVQMIQDAGKLEQFNNRDRYRPLSLKKNILYNPSATYIPRSQRPSWSCVGMLGQVAVLEEIPNSCVAGSFVSCSNNGKAIIGTNYYVIKRLSEDTILILIK